MRKIIGLIAFLAIIYLLLLAADPGARLAANHFNLGRRIGLYGIVSLGAGMLIISGGIDLSIGSVVGLCATLLAMLLRGDRFPRFPFRGWLFEQLNAGMDWIGGLVNFPEHPWAAILLVLLVGMAIGILNGLLVTKVRVQAFVVTLCGLFIYRGISRFMAEDQVKGLGNQFTELKTIFYSSEAILGLPMSLFYFLVLLSVAAIFLHWSVHGRYLFAIGANEKAARYSGIPTDRYKILAYAVCSTFAAFYGVLYLMQENSAQPSSTGNFLELYAIAGAVLGGCSLRGGEGSVGGLVIGTSILVLLPNLSLMLGIPSALEYTVIGGALLLGAILDETLRRVGQKNR